MLEAQPKSKLTYQIYLQLKFALPNMTKNDNEKANLEKDTWRIFVSENTILKNLGKEGILITRPWSYTPLHSLWIQGKSMQNHWWSFSILPCRPGIFLIHENRLTYQVSIKGEVSIKQEINDQGPLLLTWFNFNLNMDKWSHAQ